LLQRHHDGELSAAQSVQAEQLLERSASARVYLNALDELSHATRAACDIAWEHAKDTAPSPAALAELVLAELASGGGDIADAPLQDLAPLLERFHDGEVDDIEMAVVSAMLDERDDAVDYLASLDEISQGMRVVGDEIGGDVDFDGFWDGVAAGIGAKNVGEDSIAEGNPAEDSPAEDSPAEDSPVAFDRGEHLVLLHRYVDGEVSADEQALVASWVEADNDEVKTYLEALSELSLGVNAAIEMACEQADLRGIWTGVEDAIGESGVVSLADARADADARAEKQADKRDASSGSGGGHWFGEYRQAIVGALAAAVVLAGMVGLFKNQIFGPQERVIVEKRVVIVEQVEYSPGSDVMIDSPMKQVSADSDEEEDPTVIWLFDSEEEPNDKASDKASDKAGQNAPAQQDEDAGSLDEDAGRKSAPKGQPI
jgi:anti-sigma factor RsiW